MVWSMAQKRDAELSIEMGTYVMLPMNLLGSGVPKSSTLSPPELDRGKDIPTKADAAFPCAAIF